MIRSLIMDDMKDIYQIHEKFYKGEFDLPNFFNKFLQVFTVTDANERIITVGGIRTIVESVIITDKDYSVRERRAALNQMLQASLFTCSRTGYDQLHAFIQDEEWAKHLVEKAGFQPTVGKALVKLI